MKHELVEDGNRAREWPEEMQAHILKSAAERAEQNIYRIIFRVPSFDELLEGRQRQKFLMNLGAGPSFAAPYTFSDPDSDLALISLDQRDSQFADELIDRGLSPIPSELIADGPETEGREIFTVGFPSATALLGQVSQHPNLADWSSSYYSLPVSAYGRVSMLHNALPFFWGI